MNTVCEDWWVGSSIAPKARLAHHPAKGKCNADHHGLKAVVVVSCCPGPGSSWGNLAALPASKDAESPSNLILIGF